MIAVVPVRGMALAAGGVEAIAEARGRVLLVGEGAAGAAAELSVSVRSVWAWEVSGFQPGAWASALALWLERESIVILPASPDGRDLAPRLAHAMGRPLLAGAVQVLEHQVRLSRYGGEAIEHVSVNGPIVVTLLPGIRGVVAGQRGEASAPFEILSLSPSATREAEVLTVLEPDPTTIDLSEASRVIAGGVGLGSAEAFERLEIVAKALNMSVATTRAACDRGWMPADRFIGTTGVSVNPRLYVALGISGAVQHVTGLGHPEHIIAVNLDPSCPMMHMADLAIVCDAPALLRELVALLQQEVRAND